MLPALFRLPENLQLNRKTIYDLVYKAQEEVFKLCKEGSTFDTIENRISGSSNGWAVETWPYKK
jgi:hypothetical protein